MSAVVSSSVPAPSVVVTETHVQTNLRYDPSYTRSMMGAVKIAIISLNLLTFACVILSGAYWRSTGTANWTSLVCMTCFWVNLSLLLFYTFHVVEKFHKIPWLLIELVLDLLFALLLLTVAVDLFLKTSKVFFFALAAVLDSLAIGILVFDSFNKYKGVKQGDIAQGTRLVHTNKSSNNVHNNT